MKPAYTTAYPSRDAQWCHHHWNHYKSRYENCNDVSLSTLLLLPLISMRMLTIRALLSI